MDDKNKTLEELYSIMTVGGRMANEKSHALQQHAYGDPAKHVMFERERKLKSAKKAKKKRRK